MDICAISRFKPMCNPICVFISFPVLIKSKGYFWESLVPTVYHCVFACVCVFAFDLKQSLVPVIELKCQSVTVDMPAFSVALPFTRTPTSALCIPSLSTLFFNLSSISLSQNTHRVLQTFFSPLSIFSLFFLTHSPCLFLLSLPSFSHYVTARYTCLIGMNTVSL